MCVGDGACLTSVICNEEAFGNRVYGSGLRSLGSGFRVSGSGTRIWTITIKCDTPALSYLLANFKMSTVAQRTLPCDEP